MNPTQGRKPVKTAEKSELARQGAKSAARGEPSSENPMDKPEQAPKLTGEAQGHWKERRDAWKAGHDLQSTTTRDVHPPASHGRDDEFD